MLHENSRIWDIAYLHMAEVLQNLIGKPIDNITTRQKAVAFFSVRTGRRNMALNNLFGQGLYSESIPIIRRAYEDWIVLSYILSVSDASRWDQFYKDVAKLDAAVYKGFLSLTNQKDTDKIFGKLPEEISALLYESKQKLKPWEGKTFRQLSKEVGLEKLHDFVYPYLSSISHGSFKDNLEFFHVVENIYKAKAPKCDLEIETRWSIWVWWFHLRILTLAGQELGHNIEHLSEELLNNLRKGPNLNTFETCIMVKEELNITKK